MASIDYQVLLARNLRRLRDLAGWTQGELASRARDLGLEWTADTVIAIEGGRRKFALGEALLASSLLGANLEELAKAGDADLILVGGHELQAETWSALVAGKRIHRRGKSLDSTARRVEALVREKPVNRERTNDAERKAARLLGVSGEDLVELAHELWHRGLTDERDRRLRAEPGEVQLSKAQRQALRGHITRRLLAELREARRVKP